MILAGKIKNRIVLKFKSNFLNLNQIVIYIRIFHFLGSKFRRDLQIAINGVTLGVFKIPQKKNTENIAAKFCTACSNALMHIL